MERVEGPGTSAGDEGVRYQGHTLYLGTGVDQTQRRGFGIGLL